VLDNNPSDESQADLATMLAEMDSRLETLHRELEAVALPIARRSPDARRGARRASTDPVVADPAELAADVRRDAGTDAPEPITARAATRPAVRSPRAGRLADAPPSADPAAATPPERAKRRRITAVGRGRAASAAASRRHDAEAHAEAAPKAVVRQTILDAEQEARHVVVEARHRIAEIAARTRALLEHSLTAPPETQPAAPPPAASAPPTARARGPHGRAARSAMRRAYEGAVTVAAGPFEDVEQLDEFEDALASIPGVENVSIRTFERHHAHFELDVSEPTRLIAELDAQAPRRLRVVEASERALSVEIVRDATTEAWSV
jgi:hypothetical protein